MRKRPAHRRQQAEDRSDNPKLLKTEASCPFYKDMPEHRSDGIMDGNSDLRLGGGERAAVLVPRLALLLLLNQHQALARQQLPERHIRRTHVVRLALLDRGGAKHVTLK